MDHRKDFEWLVMERLGKDAAAKVDWSAPRLICIAGDFNRYDNYAVKQIQRNIELIRYRRYASDLLLLDLVAAMSAKPLPAASAMANGGGAASGPKLNKPIAAVIQELDAGLVDRFEALRAFALALGDDVQEATLQLYVAFKRIKNFLCIEFRPTYGRILLFVKVDPTTIQLEPGFTRDVRNVGHFGTGDLEITLSSADDLARAEPLIRRSYEAS
jgi:predicted transport protein